MTEEYQKQKTEISQVEANIVNAEIKSNESQDAVIELAAVRNDRSNLRTARPLAEGEDPGALMQPTDTEGQLLTERNLPIDARLETEEPLMTERLIDEQEFEDIEGGRIDFDASPNIGSPENSSKKSAQQIKDKKQNKKEPANSKNATQKITVQKAPTMRDIFQQKYDVRDSGQESELNGIMSTFKYTKPSSAKCTFIFGLLVATLNGAVGATHAFILADLIDSLNSYQNDKDVSEHLKDTLFKVALPFSGAMFLLGYIQVISMRSAANQLHLAMRSALIKSIISQEVDYFEKIDGEELPASIESKFQHVISCVTEQLGKLYFAIGAILGAIGVAVWTSPSFTAGLALSFPALLCFHTILSACFFQKSGIQEDLETQLAEFSTETFSAIRLIIGTNDEASTYSRLMKLQRSTRSQAIQTKETAGLQPVVGFGLLVLFALYGWALAGLYEEQEWTRYWTDDGDFVQVSDYRICIEAFIYAAIFLPVITYQSGELARASSAANGLMREIDREPLIGDVKNQSTGGITWTRGISFDDVSFKYPNASEHAPPILKNANFKILSGKVNAIIGETGCGKSTILKLLCRMYDPNEGMIKIGTYDDLKYLQIDQLRSQVAFVPASPNFIKGSIINNLKLGKRDADITEIQSALKLANAEFVFELENNLDTLIGYSDRGVELSLSQRQRLAIARAYLMKPRMMLVEELTARLDMHSRAKVDQAIDNIVKMASEEKVTVVISTDSYRRVEQADHVVYLESPWSQQVSSKDGGNQGRHMELMSELREKLFSGQEDVEFSMDEATEEEGPEHLDLEAGAINKFIDCPRPLKAGAQEIVEVRKRMYYGTESSRVLALALSQWRFRFIKLLSLLNAFCYPLLALLSIRLQLLYFRYSWHQDEDKLNGTFFVYLMRWDYDGDRMKLLAIFGGTLVVSIILQFLQKSLHATTSFQMEESLRQQILGSVLFKQVSWFDRTSNKPEKLTKLLTRDVTWLVEASLQREFLTFEIIGCIIVALGFGMYLNWQAAVILIVLSPMLIVVMHDFKALLTRNTPRPIPTDEKASIMLVDIIKKHRDLAILDKTNLALVTDAYERQYKNTLAFQRGYTHFLGLRVGLAAAGRNFWLLAAFYITLGINLEYLKLDKTPVLETTFVIFFVACLVGFRVAELPSWDKTEEASRNIFATIDEPSTIDARKPVTPEYQVRFGQIEVKDVSFAYEPESPLVLNNLSLSVPAESRVGLVGNKGSGRTTIAHLIRRFYKLDATSGSKISIDGIDLECYSTRRLRSFVQHVPQEPVILNLSLRDNIAMGRTNANDEQIYRAALLANATYFIEDEEEDELVRRFAVKRRLNTMIADLAGNYPSLKDLGKVDYADYLKQGVSTTDLMQLMCDTLRYSDFTMLQQITKDPMSFVKNTVDIMLQMDDPNLTWIELVLMVEWKSELEAAMKEKSVSESVIKHLTSFAKRDSFNFDPRFVLSSLIAFLAARQGGAEDADVPSYEVQRQIYLHAAQSRPHFIKRQRQRKEELLGSILSQKRQANGSFCLHPNFDRLCGKNGCNLTLSQKQRIALARVLLSDPRIIILDDLTGGMDKTSSALVRKAMEQAMQGRTTLLVSTQPALLHKCDSVYVFGDAGTIKEHGVFDDLQKNPDSYYNRITQGR